MDTLFEQISENIVEGSVSKVAELTQKALDESLAPKEIIDKALLPGMSEVGELFKEGELFVPEVLIAAKAMKGGMELLRPFLKEGDIQIVGTCIVATVKGDLHDIGLKLVGMMMESAGYEVINLGVDIDSEAIVSAVKEHNPDLIGMSAMLTTTMVSMKDTIEALKENGLYEKVKVMVGGSPITDGFADEIGASYAADASSAVSLANRLMGVAA